MGSGMTKCSSNDSYYKRRRGTKEVDSCFNKEYSEYWNNADSRKKKSTTFGMERNDFNFNSGMNEAPKRRQSQFVSSFSAENSPSSSTSSNSYRYK